MRIQLMSGFKKILAGILLCCVHLYAFADNQVGSYIYAVSPNASDGLVKFDVTSFRLLKTIALPTGTAPEILGVDPTQSYVYVARDTSSRTPLGKRTIDAISTATDTIARSFDLPLPDGYTGRISGIKFTPDGTKAFVSLIENNSVMMLSGDLTRRLSIIKTGTVTPWGGTLSPDGAWLYVPSWDSGAISVINTVSGVLQGVQSIRNWTNGSAQQVAVSPDGKRIYVSIYGPYSNQYHGEILALQPNAGHDSFTLVKQLPFSEVLSSVIQLSADGKKLYSIASSNDQNGASTYIINTETFNVSRKAIANLNNSANLTRTQDGNRIIAGQLIRSPYSNYLFSPIVSLDPAGDQVSAQVNWNPDQRTTTSNVGYTSLILVDTHPACR